MRKDMRGRHASLEKRLKDNLAWIGKIPSVKKMVLGFSQACRHKYAPGQIRYKIDVPGGIKVNAYSGKGVTDIFIKIDPISDREQVKTLIEERFQ